MPGAIWTLFTFSKTRKFFAGGVTAVRIFFDEAEEKVGDAREKREERCGVPKSAKKFISPSLIHSVFLNPFFVTLSYNSRSEKHVYNSLGHF